jgi:hypothetical protein
MQSAIGGAKLETRVMDDSGGSIAGASGECDPGSSG